MIDLHSHTRASDGEFDPDELVARALDAGIRVLAVTDHDTLASIDAARLRAASTPLRIVPGIELSCFDGEREVHLLGHFVDTNNPALNSQTERLHHHRDARVREILLRLKGESIDLTFEEVFAQSGGKNLGRPHVALALLRRGYVPSVAEAFERYLKEGRPGYVPRHFLSVVSAIGLVHDAHGTATLAHPRVSRLDDATITRFKAAGLDGIEVDHPSHESRDREELGRLARVLDLVPTAGSDFHGETVSPGRRLGTVTMSAKEFGRLEDRAHR